MGWIFEIRNSLRRFKIFCCGSASILPCQWLWWSTCFSVDVITPDCWLLLGPHGQVMFKRWRYHSGFTCMLYCHKHETLIPCCCNVVPPSQTMGQHYNNMVRPTYLSQCLTELYNELIIQIMCLTHWVLWYFLLLLIQNTYDYAYLWKHNSKSYICFALNFAKTCGIMNWIKSSPTNGSNHHFDSAQRMTFKEGTG